MAEIFGWPSADPLTDGCAYYRVEVPFRRLREEGYSVDWRHRIQESDVQLSNLVVGQRIADPQVKIYWQAWAARRTSGYGPKLVADLDDDLLRVDPSNPNYDTYSRPDVRETILTGIALADRVTVSTEPLAVVVREYADQVFVVPNSVPSWLAGHQRPRRDRLTVGWAGSDTHAMDWAGSPLMIGNDAEFHMIGGNAEWMRQGWPALDFRHTEWVPGVESYLHAIDFDVCVIPLADHVFNESKSGIKAMEMAALGIPVVASNVPAYRDVVVHGETGYLASSAQEMTHYLNELLGDRELREHLGAQARQYAMRHFTIDQVWRQWALAFTL